MQLKPEQERAIYTKNRDILVSAGAGSGKTFVMIKRIADSIKSERKSVLNLLVVTFTNAAASEMAVKLERELKRILASNECTPDEAKHIREQLDNLGQADICTLHKFCQNIIKKYFYCLDIDPSFNIADENEARVISGMALDKVLEDAKQDARFEPLFFAFDSKRNDKKVRELVEKTYDFLSNQPDLREFRARVNDSYSGDLDNNIFCHFVNDYAVQMMLYYIEQFDEIRKESALAGYDSLSSMCSNIVQLLHNFERSNTFTQNNFVLFNLPSLPRIVTAKEGCEDLRERADLLKKDLTTKLKNLREKVFLTDNLQTLQNDLQSSHNLMNLIIDLVDNYREQYRLQKLSRNVMDFGDLEHYALEILSDEAIAQQIKQTYEQVYVDEYQDINDIQESILTKIYSMGNVFLVGDVKQSIYGFRNTNPQIFMKKQSDFAKEDNIQQEAMSLNYNFRSDARILSFVNAIFGDIMTDQLVGLDYANTSKMNAGLDFASPPNALPVVEVCVLRSAKDEEAKQSPEAVYSVRDAELLPVSEQIEARSEGQIIISKITDLLQKQSKIFDPETKTFRNIKFSDITLLARSRGDYLNAIIDEIATVFPIESISKDSIFDEYEVQVLFSYLNLLNNIGDDISLTTMLVSPIIDMAEEQLAQVRLHNRECEHFYQSVLDYANTCNDNISLKINLLFDLINQGREKLENSTIFDLLNWFVYHTHYESLLSLLPDGAQRVKNLRGYINSFVGRSYNNDLYSYLAFVYDSVELPKLEADAGKGQDIINVQTMHQSKGLEYPIVFLVDTGHGFNKDSQRGDILFSNEFGLGLYNYDFARRIRYPTLARSAIKISIARKEFAESERLLYVAMTRAKNNLYIIGRQNLDKLAATKNLYAIQNSESNLALILSTLTSSEIEALKSGKDKLLIRKNDDCEFVLTSYDVIGKSAKNIDFDTKVIKLSNYDPVFEQDTHKYLGFKYPFQESTTKAYKNTVTGLLREQNEINSSFVNTPKTFGLAENKADVSTDVSADVLGTLYHKVLQGIDFYLDTAEQVRDYCQNNLSIDELKLLDYHKILSCIRSIRPLLNGATKVLREQPFLMNIPYNQLVDSNITDNTLVQGIIDLIIVYDDSAILVDYKMTKIKDSALLAQKYRLQLLCYQKAIESALNCKVKSKILYSILNEMQIIV